MYRRFLWRTGNCDTSSTAKLQDPLVSERPECSEDGVGMDAQDGSHVPRRRETLTGTDLALGDVAPNLRRDLLVQGKSILSRYLDIHNGDMHSITI